jgi:hypothetical protein
MKKSHQITDSKNNTREEPPSARRLRTGLLLIGSAIFGGIAVAFWNRRTLAKMQGQSQEKVPHPRQIDENAIY